MDLNEPLMLNGENQFCETGNRLALTYLTSAQDVLSRVHRESIFTLRHQVEAALIRLSAYVAMCPDCNEE